MYITVRYQASRRQKNQNLVKAADPAPWAKMFSHVVSGVGASP